MNGRALGSATRRVLIVWATLLGLLAATVGAAHLPLGWGNFGLAFGIAAIKATLVAWIFMALNRSSSMVRIAASVALGFVLLLGGLILFDEVTRPAAPAAAQPARQLHPLRPLRPGVQSRIEWRWRTVDHSSAPTTPTSAPSASWKSTNARPTAARERSRASRLAIKVRWASRTSRKLARPSR